jgi:hypothetical protein
MRLSVDRIRRTPARTPQLCDDAPIVPFPATITVADDRPTVLYTPDGSPLVRRIGF